MTKVGLASLVAIVAISTATHTFAQDNTPPADTVERQQVPTHSSGSGTAPEGKGTTGWTGGARDQGSQASGQSGSTDPEAAKNQPAMATGKDLKGPPEQFPAGKTPE